MTRLSRSLAIPETGPDRRKCTRCGKVKPLSREFFFWFAEPANGRAPRFSSWCRPCVGRGVAEYRQTEEYRATRAAWKARPEVQARLAEHDRARRERRKAQRREYLRSPRGRLVNGRGTAREQLKRATDEGRRTRLRELIAMYDAEIARLDSALDGRGASVR